MFSIDQSASEIEQRVRRSYVDSKAEQVLPAKRSPPPSVKCPPTTSNESMILNVPTIVIENKKDAMSPVLQEFCYRSPLCVIRGITAALKMDLGLYSTKTLYETAPSQQVEVRTQLMLNSSENFDSYGRKCWTCESHRSYTTIKSYAHYQATSFQQALRVILLLLFCAGSTQLEIFSGRTRPRTTE